MQLFDEHLEPQRFTGKTHHDISTAFVDVMLLVYSGAWRGVLRKAYAFISEKPEGCDRCLNESAYSGSG